MAVAVRALFPAGTTTATTVGAVTTITTSVTTVAGDVLEVHTNLEVGTDTGFSLACKFDPAGSNLSPDGQSVAVHSNGQTAGFERVFYYLNPPVGTFNVTVTASGGTPADMTQKCLAISGTDNAAPTITTFAPSGTGTTTAMTITTPSSAGGLVLGHFCAGSGVSSVSGTQQCIAQNGTAVGAASAIGDNSAAGTGGNVTLTGTLGGADWYAAIATSWGPAGGAPQSTFVRPQFMQGALQPGGQYPPPIQSALPFSWAIVPPFPAVQDAVATPFIAKVDPTGRYFTNPVGTPISPVIDHQWHLIAWGGGRSELSPGTTTPLLVFQAYAAHQAAKGFNGALVMAICSDQGGPLGPFTDGRTWDGIAPWGAGGIGDLNPTYWSRVDDMINSFAAQGMTAVMNIVASYTIATGTALAGITTTNANAYGVALAARYKNFPNIVWHIGADYFATKEAEFLALITGLRNGGDTHLVTVEYMAESDTRKDSTNTDTGSLGQNSLISYDDIYTYNAAYLEVERSYGLASPNTRPALYFNGRYDQSTGGYDTVVLDDILWAMTSGAPGHYYGSEATWKWEATSYSHVLADNLPNVWLPLFQSFFTALPHWERLIPDIGSAFITSARGTKVTALAPGGGATAYTGGNTYLTGAVTADGTLAVLYTPTNRTITIDGSKMVASYSATWVDPYTFATTAATPSATSYATPGTNSQGDNRWLLVLQQSSATTLQGAATLVGSGTFAALAGNQVNPAATLVGGGTFGAAASVTTLPAATLVGAGTLTSAGVVTQPAAATLAGLGTFAAAAVVSAPLNATLVGGGTFTAGASNLVLSAATLAGSGTISAAATDATFPTATLAGAGTFAAAAGVTTFPAATLGGAGTFTSAGVVSSPMSATLTGTGTFTSAASVTVLPAATLGGVGTFVAGATRTQPGTATLAGTGTFVAGALNATFAAAALGGVGTFTSAGTVTPASGASATLVGTGTLSAGASVKVLPTALLVGQGTLASSGTVTGTGTLYRYVPEWLVTDALLALLKANLPVNVKVYDHSAPREGREMPYIIVYRIPGGEWWGPPLTDPEADIMIAYQIDAVGQRRDQVEMLGTRVGQIVTGYVNGALEHTLSLPLGVHEYGRLRADVPPGIDVEGTPPHQVYTYPGRYHVAVTPS